MSRNVLAVIAVVLLAAVVGCVPQGSPGRYVPVVPEGRAVMSFDTQTGTMRATPLVR